MYKLGKLPARPDAVKLKFGAYFSAPNLPTPPQIIEPPALSWGMLGNDRVGDCVWAGAAHETMAWRQGAGLPPATFTSSTCLEDYSACTGYDPKYPITDKGTDVQNAAAYRQKTGIIDALGQRHKIDVYTALAPGNVDELLLAVYLFGVVGVGVVVPASAPQQFANGQPWDINFTGKALGGHYIPCVGRNSAGNFIFVTWGRLQAATPDWVEAYMDEGVAMFSREELTAKGLSPAGFDLATLNDDLNQLTS